VKVASTEEIRRSVGQWFRDTRRQEGMTIIEVAEKLGMGKASISTLEIQGISYKTASKHAEVLGWEIPPLSEILASAPVATDDPNITLQLSPIAASAGHGSDATSSGDEIRHLSVPAMWVRQQYPGIQNLRSLGLCKASGESMNPLFAGSDTLLVDTSDTTADREGVYVFTYADAMYVKLLRRDTKGVNVVSINPAYPPWHIPIGEVDQMEVHGKVLGKWVGFVRI